LKQIQTHDEPASHHLQYLLFQYFDNKSLQLPANGAVSYGDTLDFEGICPNPTAEQ
jgi:hypothetical protein